MEEFQSEGPDHVGDERTLFIFNRAEDIERRNKLSWLAQGELFPVNNILKSLPFLLKFMLDDFFTYIWVLHMSLRSKKL